MRITCPRCLRTLPSSDETLRYCAFCGFRLADAPPSPESRPSPVTSTAELSPERQPPPEEPAPESIGGYRVVRLLGVGGMGRVYEAEWAATGQRVAVKVLSSQLATNPVSLERFRQEGRLASQLSHPRCVFILGADTDHGRPYIVMELMPGDTLKDLVDRRGPLPPQEAIRFILDVIEGLQEAHRHGVIHRDVKPSNCFLMPDGRVKIGDFGLSKSLTATNQLTQSGAFLGTVLYASPEQIRGEQVDYASDVYSVAATLYHLLAGQAPFQTENVTAALSRIITEDAPPLRTMRPEVPRALARVVERGLERDRGRRYETLEELRAALVALVPEHLSFGGLSVRVAAYLLDEVLVGLFLVLPLAGLLRPAVSFAELPVVLQQVLAPVYFIILEGRWGASLGKRLLRLRVCRLGATDPPGLRRALVRTLVFALLVNMTLAHTRILFNENVTAARLLASAVPFVLGLVLLVAPMRRSNNFRGLHELLSGTCTLMLPRPPRPLRLSSAKESPLLALPARPEPIPKTIGAYPIRSGARLPDGGYLLVGEDSLLGRQVLIRLQPAGSAKLPTASRHAISRSARLRFLQSGTTTVEGKEIAWEVFVAPGGRPLADVTSPNRRLSWHEARPILEQLSEELATAQTDGTTPAVLSLDQVWVEPDGRVELLDVPLPGADTVKPLSGGLPLLRETATLALEGKPRSSTSGTQVCAPVPRHAARILHRLLGGPKAYPNLDAFRVALQGTRELLTQVSQPMRLGQIGLMTAVLSLGLVMMFALSGLFAVLTVLERTEGARQGERLLEALASPDARARLATDPAMPRFVSDPQFPERVAFQVARDRAERESLFPALSALERFLLREFERGLPEYSGEVDPADPKLAAAAKRAYDSERSGSALTGAEWILPGRWRPTAALILMWPFLWAVGSFVLRGGVSYLVLGIAIVRNDGRKAGRLQCAARALIVWLPIALLLVASVWVQAHRPDLVTLHATLWWGAVLLLIAYPFLALINPEQGLHDRWLGTRLVPR
jgi:eukaryotic-like serine/threonine-protein kinase